MAEPFLAEIRAMACAFAPKGWAACDGQLLQINQNQALFALLGTTYGGDGRTTFALLDLRGRAPIHAGAGHALGDSGGEMSHTLAGAEMPAHTHTVVASSRATAGSAIPSNKYLGAAAKVYAPAAGATLTRLRAGTVTKTGGGQAHDNAQPYLTLKFCIALQGIFPSVS